MPETSATLIEGIGDEVVLFACASVTFAVVALTALYLQYAFQRGESSRRGQTPRQNLSPQSQHQAISSSARSDNVQRETVSPVSHFPTNLETTLQCERNTAVETKEQSQDAEHDLAVHQDSVEDKETPGDDSALRQRRLDFFERRERSESQGSSSTEELNSETSPQGSREEKQEGTGAATDGFPIRLKYLNDTERCVTGRPDETVGSFKRRHFAAELESQRLVRLIFNGGQLRDDSAALSSCGLCSGCVVHVHISTAPVPPSDPGASNGEGELNLTALMWPLFATSLGILWVLHFQYGDLFNTSSTVVLVGISGLFCIGLYGQHYPQSPHTLVPESDQRMGPPPGR